MEILLTVEVKDVPAVPIQISVVYHDDGEIASVDWRHALPDIVEAIDLEEYNSDDDEDWIPPLKVDFEEEILEYMSTDDETCSSEDY